MSIVAVVLTGCERELGFDEGGEDLNVIAISMVASPDTTLEAIVARTYRAGVVGTEGTDVEETFLKSATLRFATVAYSVNGGEPVAMTYDAERCRFRSDYRPKAGDVIMISASEPNFPSAAASVTMPVNVPSVEIVRARKYQQDYTLDLLETGRADGGQDTVVDITLRMKGLEASGHYRLNVRSLTEKVVDGKTVYDANDCFHSYDPLFKDIRLTKPRDGWYSEFSNVFDGMAAGGHDYECTVTTRLRNGAVGKRIVEVRLQSVTEDLYYYLKSVMLYQVYMQTINDAQTEAVQIHSNVDGGYGIAGGLMSSPRQTVVF